MELKTKSFKGAWDCLSITNGTVELIISVNFGPRILFYGYEGGQNFFRVFEDQVADTDKDIWQNYGGHRLWHAPEVKPRTYYADNEPVDYTWDNNVLTLDCPLETTTGLQKEITIELAETGTGVKLNHRLINRNVWDVEVAAWCLSVMAPGGRVIIPQEEYISHDEYLVPARPLVLWHFTDMSDPRFTWGDKYIQMAQDEQYNTKLKIGTLNKQGWEVYSLNNEVFIKRHDYFEGKTYTDMGCNCEFFTMPGFLEMESLSPYEKLAPEAYIDHREEWELKKVTLGSDEAEIDKLIN